MSQTVPVQNGNLPQGFCPSDYQSILNAFSAAQSVTLPTLSGLIISASPPADHSQAWLQLDSSGRPVRVYFFAQGAWLSPHPLLPGFTMLWNQGLPDFTVFDGGDNTAAPFGALSGKMWQLMATTLDGLGTQVMQAQFPVGVGTFANSGAVAVTNTGGEDKHKLLLTELAPHVHPPLGASDTGFINTVASGGSGSNVGGTLELARATTGSAGGDPATGTPPSAAAAHNTLPPYYGVYFIQRTNRLFYVVNA